MEKINKKGNCIRNVSNYSVQKIYNKFDKINFNVERFKKEYPIASPKLDKLIKIMKALDETDLKNHGKLFKHIIYTDLKNSSSGSKMIAGGLIVNGYNNAYNNKLSIDTKELEKNEYYNFALLCSVDIYNKPFSVKLRKNILKIYNDRPSNINGKYIRFLILDQGFKEGIDVFDVKYVHLFEPLLSKADERQAIGRGTRFCGQKGLNFDPEVGWPLYVFKYEIIMNERLKLKYNEETVTNLFIRESKLNLDKLLFANELENISRYGAIDYELNKSIHDYGNEPEENNLYIPNDESLKTIIGIPYELAENSLKLVKSDIDDIYLEYKKNKVEDFVLSKKVVSPFKILGGGIKGKKKKGLNLFIEKAPQHTMNFIEMRNYINDRFIKYKWDKIKFENKCIDEKEENKVLNDRIIKFTPTQEFVSNYFNNTSYNKGLLLWHSVGTGKTCSAIAIASRGFENHGYTILWVTRHTLKPDIWKNIFNNVCSITLQRKIKKGEFVPEGNVRGPLKYLNNWLMPISYKQFSNMLLEKNLLYKEMKKRNGEEDPLRKTLVIIDEAHKLYSNDLPLAERPNLNILKDKIKKSYRISKNNSVRLLLMTATPYTNNPMDLIKIINLMKEENEEIPEDFNAFKEQLLDINNKFTDKGSKYFLDNISGYISYLNRERDARQFAYPVFYKILVEMSETSNNEINNKLLELGKINNTLLTLQEKLKNSVDKIEKKNIKEEIKNIKKEISEFKKTITKEKKSIKKDDISQEFAIDKCLEKK